MKIINGETTNTSVGIAQVMEWYERGKLNIKPEYQRNDVWSTNKKRELIESLMNGCPIPSLMFSITQDEQINVLDGKQRLSSVIEFVNNKFKVRDLFFDDFSQGEQTTFLIKQLPISQTRHLSLDDEATIFERINRAEKLSDGERIDSYFKSALALERDKFFNKDNINYNELTKYFGQYDVGDTPDKRKAKLTNKTTMIVVFADKTVDKSTFECLQPYLELTESQWTPYKARFHDNINKFIELWRTLVNEYKINIPEQWKKPSKLWKYSFLTAYIIYSMEHDKDEYRKNWIQFIVALCKNPDLYSEWPHTTLSREKASKTAKQIHKSRLAQGYYQLKYYNEHGAFDDCVGNITDSEEE